MNVFKAKLWIGLGGCAMAATPAAMAAPPAPLSAPAPVPAAAPGTPTVVAFLASAPVPAGEGGEGGGEAGEHPGSYKLFSTNPADWNYDGRPQVKAYADHVYAAYVESHKQAQAMQKSIAALAARPSAKTLAAARKAWLDARPSYLMTEAFRYYGGPIDTGGATPGPEGRLNAWPLNEAFIDYVRGNDKAGLVNDDGVAISRDTLLERDQVSDESDVTTGWHAIEFLLWGQDFNANGPGDRPFTDYAKGKPGAERRAQYLTLVTKMLVDDLDDLAAQWQPGDSGNYRAHFESLEPREAIGRMLNGMANLAGYELTSERMSVALDSGDQEDEHSCFSDNTHNDHLYDFLGVRRVYEAGGNASLAALARKLDPKVADRLSAQFELTEAAIRAIPHPFDQMLASPPGSEGRRKAEAAVDALNALTQGLRDLGKTLGVLVIVSGG